jgi:hypothetical protein
MFTDVWGAGDHKASTFLLTIPSYGSNKWSDHHTFWLDVDIGQTNAPEIVEDLKIYIGYT